jgi:transposase-like protein
MGRTVPGAVDNQGNTIDFYLSPMRNTAAAKRFSGKAMHSLKDWEKPKLINTDKGRPTLPPSVSSRSQEAALKSLSIERSIT